ncbi:MAG: hypothetical protein M0R06_02080 [Sphaerochaeta sp.]|jgi:ribosomal protein L32|nr:hypothetical protein [Sphaerochaeta sp.]
MHEWLERKRRRDEARRRRIDDKKARRAENRRKRDELLASPDASECDTCGKMFIGFHMCASHKCLDCGTGIRQPYGRCRRCVKYRRINDLSPIVVVVTKKIKADTARKPVKFSEQLEEKRKEREARLNKMMNRKP